MKTTLTGACVAAFAAMALTASAQQPAPQTPPPQPTPAPSASVKLDKDVTLTGCIKAGTAPGAFELTNIKKGAGSATEPSAAKDAKIMLSAAAGADLASHVGHTVEVTGTWGAAAAAAPPSATAPAGEAKAGKSLTVSNVKMVSATCTTGTN
jgi:hypothetical protein